MLHSPSPVNSHWKWDSRQHGPLKWPNKAAVWNLANKLVSCTEQSPLKAVFSDSFSFLFFTTFWSNWSRSKIKILKWYQETEKHDLINRLKKYASKMCNKMIILYQIQKWLSWVILPENYSTSHKLWEFYFFFLVWFYVSEIIEIDKYPKGKWMHFRRYIVCFQGKISL